MPTGHRVTAEDKAKVVIAKLQDPNKSLAKISEETGISPTSVDRIIKRDIGQHLREEDMITEILKNDLVVLADGTKLASETIAQKLKAMAEGKDARVDWSKLASILGDATKRRQLFTGGATENVAVGVTTYLPSKED